MHSRKNPQFQSKLKHSLIGLIFILSIALLFTTSIQPIFAQEEPSSESIKLETDNFSLEKLRLFSEVYNKIRQAYVDEIDNEELFKNAINGMINGLDPHSNFMEAKSYENLKINTVGEFGGLGITVSMENDFVKVISPIDDTPADKAGIEAGDLIILLNDVRVKGLTLDEAVEIMRGKPGTDIKITVVREGEPKPIEFNITREVIKLTSVKSNLIGNDKGYLRISHFNLNTISEAREALDDLNQQAEDQTIKGLIIDLRNNPGGALRSAIDISDLFLDGGDIVSTKSRSSGLNESFAANAGDVLEGKPIVVMINNGSASASEIVSGALQDHQRAIIIGTKSFGKASVQTIIPLSQGDAIKLTTARYYTPSGTSIQSNGITPDIFSPNATLVISEEDFELRESNLNRHLIGEDEKLDDEANSSSEESDDQSDGQSDGQSEQNEPITDEQKDDDLSDAKRTFEEQEEQENQAVNQSSEREIEDYMLYEATNILDSLILFSEQSNQ